LPVHRVVNASGLLTGKHHFETPTTMEKALQKEGVKIKDGIKVLNFDAVLWDPNKELL